MAFSHVLITRPREEARELEKLLASSAVTTIIMPAYNFHATSLFPDQINQLEQTVSGQQA